jgi:WD40 repeat protein
MFKPSETLATSANPPRKKATTPNGTEKPPFPKQEKKITPLDHYIMPEHSFDEETKFILPKLEEDFDVTEGNTFKGHSGPVRDIVKINLNEFVSCDETG